VVEGGTRPEGVHRLQPDGPGPHHRLRLLAAGERPGHGLHPGHLG
jgi:hypothetical protein